jgi:translation initiation factor 1
MRDDAKSTPVYSSAHGSLCRSCGQPQARCACRHAKEPPRGDGIVRVGRGTKGRKGKAVTVITGVPLPGDALRELAGDLKRSCGSGATLRDGVIEIQGDHRDRLVEELQRRGYRVKRAGGQGW